MTPSPQRRIFLIGFNKCGTTSFHDYFKANGITSVHWRANTLALALHRNRAAGRPLLEGIDRWTAYTDMNCIPGSPWGRSNSDDAPLIEGCRYFSDLHQEHPDALFILNTRDPSDWLRSRLQHDQGRFAAAYLQALAGDGIRNRRQLKQRWLTDWYQHHAEVWTYFQSKAPKQLLLFHISATPVGKLNRFLAPHFTIRSPQFPHHHQSAKRANEANGSWWPRAFRRDNQ